jgi:tyrosyl-tRNA synthetase
MEEVKRLSASRTHKSMSEKNTGLRITKQVHGEEEAKKAQEASNALFSV